MQNFELAQAYVATIAGDSEATVDFRVLHDQDKSVPGQTKRGTLRQCWSWLCAMNEQGYGVFMVAAQLDGNGQKMDNVVSLRCNYIDIDSADAQQQYERAIAAHPKPTFAVQSSPGKYHVFWKTSEHVDRQRFTLIQRRLASIFNSDPKVSDATRVLRLAGTIHRKTNVPHLVTCWALDGFTTPTTIDELDAATAHVQVVDGGDGERLQLGDPSMAAPSLDWIQFALDLADPNDIDRDEWVGLTCSIKQAGWTLTDEATLRSMWDKWCARYEHNVPGENDKLWRSITSTELGWKSLLRRVPSLQASVSFGVAPTAAVAPSMTPPMPVQAPPVLDCSGEYLTHIECQEYFKGCYSIVSMGKIMTPKGMFLNQAQFNLEYGGKQFIITGDGAKKTDEPWKAATRSTLWTIPTVDNVRFSPLEPPGQIIHDVLGRSGINAYIPARIPTKQGDPSLFFDHLARLFPVEADRRILVEWMAHIIKYPGYKIPWAPVIQSAEGAGKGVFKALMTHAIGAPYVHFPDAQQLADSGGKFNGWMRRKLFILADEIRVGEKHHLIEVLKPLISEKMIEIQSKGIDQEMEDNPACWGFFTNYKNAVPVGKNGRRYAFFFSPFQTEAELIAAGMDDAYFNRLFSWLQEDGCAIVTKWLMDYTIERGAIPMRAPKTSSSEQAAAVSRSPIETVIDEAVDDSIPGFRGGWVSSIALINRCKALQAVKGTVSPSTLSAVLEGMGYREMGRANRPWFQEDREARTTLFYNGAGDPDVATYGRAQGWE